MIFVVFVVSLVLAAIICKIINRNSFGTIGAYVKRFIIVWSITFVILAGIFGFI